MEGIKERKRRKQELNEQELKSKTEVQGEKTQEVKVEKIEQETKNTKVKKASKKRKKWKVALLVVAGVLLVAAVAGFAVFKYYYNLLDIQLDGAVENEQDIQINVIDSTEEEDEVYNVMLLGVDSRNNDFEGATDTMMLFSVNPNTEKIVMTSFQRDTYFSLPGYWEDRLNLAYFYGGTELLSKTLDYHYGVKVDNYVMVNFWLVSDFIDALGGVEIDLTAEEIEVLNSYLRGQNQLLVKPKDQETLTASGAGVCLLNGNQALGHARNRYVGNEFTRTGRQREIVTVCIEKLKQKSITELNELLKQFLPRVRTNMTEKDLTSLLFMALDIKNYQMESMVIPVDGTWESALINEKSVLVVDTKANAEAWHKKVYEP